MSIKAIVSLTDTCKAKMDKVIVLNEKSILQIIADSLQESSNYADESERWAIGEIADLPAGSAKYWAGSAKNYSQSAETSASNAKKFADLADSSKNSAKTSEDNASASRIAAKTSETAAASSASAASNSAGKALMSEKNAKNSETNSANSATQAANSAATTLESKNTAVVAASTATAKADAANISKEDSCKWAIGSITEQTQGSAKYWAEKAQEIGQLRDASESVKGIVQLATDAEMLAATDNSKAVTPVKLKKYIDENINGLPLGTRIESISKIAPAGTIKADDGAEYTEAIFPDFFQWLLTEGQALTCTYAEWQNKYTAQNGNVAEIAVDPIAKKFKMSSVKSGVFVANKGNGEVTYQEAGLPHLKGTAKSDGLYSYGLFNRATGVFKLNPTYYNFQTAPGDGYSSIEFDANNYNKIFGNSNTVTPEHVRYYYYMVVANVVVTASDAQMSEIMGAMAGKLNVDGSNLTAQGKTNLQDVLGMDVTTIYPNNGTSATPATVSINSRYVNANPFPGHNIICVLELKYNNQWCSPGSVIYSAGGYGAAATHLLPDDTIITQTGSVAVLTFSINSGNGFNMAGNIATPLPCRVKVWRCKG